MRRQVLYSGSRRTPGAGRDATLATDAPITDAARTPDPGPRPRFQRLRAFGARHAGLLRFLGGACCAMLIVAAYLWWQPRPHVFTQEEIDAAVLHTLETKSLPARAAKAAEICCASSSLRSVTGLRRISAKTDGESSGDLLPLSFPHGPTP